METTEVKYIIIGAGLSGLTSGYQLMKADKTDFIILESRDRPGGRVFTKDRIDFGATWFQEHHEHVLHFLDELGIRRFPQFSKGQSVLVYNTMAPAHYFESDNAGPHASRIEGGTKALIEALASPIRDKIKLNSPVTAIQEEPGGITVTSGNNRYHAKKVIVTIPPRIATRIDYKPELPSNLSEVMENTHTWMSNAIKVGMTFKSPFWRDKNLSGTIIGQVSPVVELYDHSDMEDKHFALMGFINEALRDNSADQRKKIIIEYLSKYLGDEVNNYLTYEEKDWSQDRDTSCESIKSIYMSPQYGSPVFHRSYMSERLIFSGAEISPVYGGYMDGAIRSGILSAKNILV